MIQSIVISCIRDPVEHILSLYSHSDKTENNIKSFANVSNKYPDFTSNFPTVAQVGEYRIVVGNS